MILFAGLGFAGAYGLFSDGSYIASSDGVMSAYVLEVRAPIDGTITELPLASGVLVHRGAVVGRVQNPLADHQHLDNLSAEAEASASAAEALEREQNSLELQRRRLLLQARLHDRAVTARFAGQVAEAKRIAASDDFARDQTTADLQRGEKLHGAGIISTAEFERLRSAADIAGARASASHAAVDALRTQAVAAAQGIMAEPGQNMDVSYSRQRADEIAMKMVENSRSLEASRAQADFVRASAATEATRADGLHAAELRSPISGMLWDLNATNGERVGAADTVLTLVDCSRQFLLALIPQDRVPDVSLHATARFRLSGESVDRTGTVLSVTGADKKVSAHKLAAAPDRAADKSADLATVLIAPDAFEPSASAGGSCQIGRTARVLIPTVPSTLVSRWMRVHL